MTPKAVRSFMQMMPVGIGCASWQSRAATICPKCARLASL